VTVAMTNDIDFG